MGLYLKKIYSHDIFISKVYAIVFFTFNPFDAFYTI